MRLCSGAAIFMGLGGTYALWGSVAIWMVGALAAFIAGALVYAAPTELCRPRKRFLSGGNRIALTQDKTNKRIWVPCHERLRRVLNSRLAEMPPEQLAFLTTRSGGPMDVNYLRHEWREVTLAAGLDGLQFRDLRRTGMVRMAEAGATAVQISAISGHSIEATIRILETYIPRNAAMAAAAVKLQERADRKRAKRNQPTV